MAQVKQLHRDIADAVIGHLNGFREFNQWWGPLRTNASNRVMDGLSQVIANAIGDEHEADERVSGSCLSAVDRVAEIDYAAEAPRIAYEYFAAKHVIDRPPPQQGGFGAPRTWSHHDPEVIRFYAATAALMALSKIHTDQLEETL